MSSINVWHLLNAFGSKLQQVLSWCLSLLLHCCFCSLDVCFLQGRRRGEECLFDNLLQRWSVLSRRNKRWPICLYARITALIWVRTSRIVWIPPRATSAIRSACIPLNGIPARRAIRRCVVIPLCFQLLELLDQFLCLQRTISKTTSTLGRISN